MPKQAPNDGSGSNGTATERALAELVAGRMVLIVDSEDPLSDGAVAMAAQFATPEALDFMNRRAGGWVCLALTAERCDQLGLEPVPASDQAGGTPFMTTFQARVRAGGSGAPDPAVSIQVAIDPSRGAAEITTPGHVQPLRAEAGGVLKLAGHTEAAVDLVRLADLSPAAVICEVQDSAGAIAGPEALAAFCREHRLSVVEIGDVIAYRHRNDRLVERLVDVALPTRHGDFLAIAYRSLPEEDLHLAYVKGEVAGAEDVLVRVHTGCLTGDAFHSSLCGCGEKLEASLEMIEQEGRGVLVYLDPAPSGRGVLAELAGEASHHDPPDGPGDGGGGSATLRRHGIGAQILKDLGLSSIRVLTGSPRRIVGLEGFGLEVTAQIPLQPRSAQPQAR